MRYGCILLMIVCYKVYLPFQFSLDDICICRKFSVMKISHDLIYFHLPVVYIITNSYIFIFTVE